VAVVSNHAGWLATLQALMPPGRAFTRAPGSMWTKLLSALAAMLLAVQLKLEDLLEQADPRKATSMLPDWERMLALPDRCTPAGQQIADRQRAAYQRLVEEGGQSRPYFIGLSLLLGEPDVTITEFRRFTCNSNCNDALCGPGDVFAWRVNIPHPAQDVRWFNCNSPCTAALQEYTPSLIECALTERKPAETNVLFSYAA
jgi:uncharacterized protein YmfQ (DUF2313 family)